MNGCAARKTGTTLMLLFSIALGAPHASRAQSIYKCGDAQGHFAYQDHACTRGLRETLITFAAAPAPHASPDYAIAAPARSASARKQPGFSRLHGKPVREAMSWECRADNGEIFYRHSRCPASIRLGNVHAGGRGRGRVVPSSARVTGLQMTRHEVCRRLAATGSMARNGHQRDDQVSTYERNAGRDPCRHH